MDTLKPLASSELGHNRHQQQQQTSTQIANRLTSSEFNTSWTKQKCDSVPYVHPRQETVLLNNKIEELNQRYEEMSMALIQLQTEMEQIKTQKMQKSKCCPICLDEMINRDKKIACFDCGHWICEECIVSADNKTTLRLLSAQEKQTLLMHLLVHVYKQSHVIQLEEPSLVFNLEDDKYVLYFEGRVNLYKNTKNVISYTIKPAPERGQEKEELEDQKPALQSLFSEQGAIYCLDCPMCKTKSCHFKRAYCYKLVYF